MKLKAILPVAVFIVAFSSCKKTDTPGPVGKYPADVANAWMQMQIRLTKSTTGYNSLVSDRSFGYAGITMYEALVPGIPGYRSLLPQMGGTSIPTNKNRNQYYWPASVNAAMAMLTKSFLKLLHLLIWPALIRWKLPIMRNFKQKLMLQKFRTQ